MSDIIDSNSAGAASSMMKLEKAYLLIVAPSSPAGGALAASVSGAVASEAASTGSNALQSQGGKGMGGMGASGISESQTAVGGNLGNKITFMFNPLSYTITKQGTWERGLDEGATSTSIPTWKGAGPRIMNVEVFLDASYSESSSIQPDIDLLFDCCKPTMESVMLMRPSPPFVLFGWGLTTGFLSYMSSVVAEYTLFRPDGTPLRAKCNLTMEEIPVTMARQNPTSGGSVRRIRRTVAGDTLASVSYREYGRPTMWRALALANGIDDPLRVAPGTDLQVPSVNEATARS